MRQSPESSRTAGKTPNFSRSRAQGEMEGKGSQRQNHTQTKLHLDKNSLRQRKRLHLNKVFTRTKTSLGQIFVWSKGPKASLGQIFTWSKRTKASLGQIVTSTERRAKQMDVLRLRRFLVASLVLVASPVCPKILSKTRRPFTPYVPYTLPALFTSTLALPKPCRPSFLETLCWVCQLLTPQA